MSTPVLDVRTARKTDDDPTLLARARSGEAQAVDELVQRYMGDVYAVTFRVLQDAELAQDAAQEALVSALRALPGFRGDSSLRTWIMRIALNAARTMARRRHHRREVALEAAAHVAEERADAADDVAIKDEAHRALRMLEQLPEKQRLAVMLRVNQGLSYREIGTVLDCTEGAARVNYHLGVKRLRELTK